MIRTPQQRVGILAAAALALAPVGFGIYRALSTGDDYRMLWMALVASIFAGSVLTAALGRRRSRHAVITQSAAILVIATLLAGGTGFMLGATAGPGVWMVATVFGILLAGSSVLVAVSRPPSP